MRQVLVKTLTVFGFALITANAYGFCDCGAWLQTCSETCSYGIEEFTCTPFDPPFEFHCDADCVCNPEP